MDVSMSICLSFRFFIVGCASMVPTTRNATSPTPLEATCHVGIWIETDGTISVAQIVKSSGYPRLDDACLKGVTRCQAAQRLRDRHLLRLLPLGSLPKYWCRLFGAAGARFPQCQSLVHHGNFGTDWIEKGYPVTRGGVRPIYFGPQVLGVRP
jgi:TonB family protein